MKGGRSSGQQKKKGKDEGSRREDGGTLQSTRMHGRPIVSSSFLDLLPELVMHIFSFLDAKDLCQPICKNYYSLGQDTLLWKHLSARKMPPSYHPPPPHIDIKHVTDWKSYCKELNREEWSQERCGDYIMVSNNGLTVSNTKEDSPHNPSMRFCTVCLQRSLKGHGCHTYTFRLDAKGGHAGVGFGLVPEPINLDRDISRAGGWCFFGHGMCYLQGEEKSKAVHSMEAGDEFTMIVDLEGLRLEFFLNSKPLRGFEPVTLPTWVKEKGLFIATSLSRSKVTLLRWKHQYLP